jgi:hypothetical protein
MRNARRLIFAAFVITGLPALALFILSVSGRWAGDHDAASSVMLQALGVCMAVSALLLVVGVSRAAVSLLSAPVTRDPMNVATSALGASGLVAIIWFGWRMFMG